jgi:hypothetical protein
MFLRISGKAARRLPLRNACRRFVARSGSAYRKFARRRLARVVAASFVLCAASGPSALAADLCPNAALRTGVSGALPDCRAYELVSPDLNHAAVATQLGARATANGNLMVYSALDAPDRASAGSAGTNPIRAQRDPVSGWSGISLVPPVLGPVLSYQSFQNPAGAISPDLFSTYVESKQGLTGGPPTNGYNSFIGRRDGSFRLVTASSSPVQGGFVAGNSDFSQVYFVPAAAQLLSDPLPGGNVYSWSERGGLHLVGILPNGTPAPNGARPLGAVIGPTSGDGTRILFVADEILYLRANDSQTVEIGPINYDPTQQAVDTDRAGISVDGRTVLFTSRAALTGPSNTGPSNGGRDIYSYDVGSGHLTDITVDTNPGDVNGADVGYVMGASQDGAYVYFTATGKLAGETPPGRSSIYVWHDGIVDLVANADGLFAATGEGGAARFYVTPDGRHIVFPSTDSLTGYDNIDPVTNERHVQVFVATFGAGVQCASCRADGTRPTADSNIKTSTEMGGAIRVASDDGKRVFFESSDAVTGGTSGIQRVFEYENGQPRLISRADSDSPAFFLEASASGDDVFFASFDDLVPNPNSGDSAVFDARVGGGFPGAVDGNCSGAACRAPANLAPTLPSADSLSVLGTDTAGRQAAVSGAAGKLTVAKTKVIAGPHGILAVTVPGKGRLTVSGTRVRTKRVNLLKAQTIKVRVTLNAKATAALRRGRTVKANVKSVFTDSGGRSSTVTLLLTFRASVSRDGRSS